MRAMGFICVMLACGVCHAQGVIVPEGGFANTIVSATGSGATVYNSLVGVPEDDSGRWNITLMVDGSSASRQVEQLFRTDPYLLQLSAWGHFNVHSVDQVSQKERFNAFQAAEGCLPLLAVYPPIGSRTYPYQYVVRKSGHSLASMPGRDLAAHIVAKVRDFVKSIRGEPCPGPNCPLAPRPTPQPYSPVNPYVPPLTPVTPPLPDIPDITPTPTPDNPDTPDTLPPVGVFPDYPMVTIITDPQGIGETIKAKALEMVISKIAEEHQGFTNAKARSIRLSDPEAKPYPVGPQDTPCVVLTNRGQIVGFFTRGVLDLLKQHLTLPIPDVETKPAPLVIPPATVIVDTKAQAEAVKEQTAAAQKQAEDQGKFLQSVLTTLGISMPVAAGLLGLLILVAVPIWKRRGGLEGYRDRREDRWDWVEGHAPAPVARGVERVRDRYGWDRPLPEQPLAPGAVPANPVPAPAVSPVPVTAPIVTPPAV